MEDKEMQPLVSVVVPVYNASGHLCQAIDSVLNQSYGKLELILVDDCSTDESMQIMQEYAARDSRIQILACEQNLGVAEARNLGIRRAAGQYIALLDSDDFWERSKLERQLALMKREKAEIAYCSVEFVDKDSRRLKTFRVPGSTNYREMLFRCYFICSTVVVESSLLKAHPFKSEYYHEDFLLWLELLSLPIKAVGETATLAYYRQISGSRSNNKLHAAKHRWDIYRNAVGMNIFQSGLTFIRYAFWGVVKYYT